MVQTRLLRILPIIIEQSSECKKMMLLILQVHQQNLKKTNFEILN